MKIEELTKLADDWQQASHHDAFGMGAGSGMMAKAHDDAKIRFIAGLDTTRPAELADALVELRDTKKRNQVDKQAMIKVIRDGIIGAIKDLRAGDETVQVMMRWSQEFYDQIMKDDQPQEAASGQQR